MKLVSICLLTILFGADSFGGSVSSGGGKFIGTEYNPWFLENTPLVRYCIDIDPRAFKPSRESIERAVEFAIKKWQSTFRNRMIDDPYYQPGELKPFSDVRLATQKFNEVRCNEKNIDLRFQFGRLTNKQKKILPGYKGYVGVAVRSNYDLKRLKGTGFIYIAADSGANRPDVENFAKDPWSVANNAVLKFILIHELGHVFGLRHETGYKHVMSEALVDLYVKQRIVDAIADSPDLVYVNLLNHLHILNYNPNQVVIECEEWPIKRLVELLGLSSSTKCIRLSFSHNTGGMNKLRIKVETSIASNAHFIFEGIIESRHGLICDARPIIELKLPKGQKVFTKLPGTYWDSRLFAGYEKITSRRFKAKYTNDSGNVINHMFGEIKDDGRFRIGAYDKGEIELEIFSY